MQISIHAPARGATLPKHLIVFLLYISIHAPARGATIINSGLKSVNTFQSTLPRGERHVTNQKRPSVWQFQSTLLRGERQGRKIYICNYSNFNPRSREGSDWKRRPRTPGIFISIHAPARGATRQNKAYNEFCKISIHAPARGATFWEGEWAGGEVFQSTLPRGERLLYLRLDTQ
mgnify:CR=1 FL=1